MDRAFATFQEIGTIFDLQRDVHSYNSLLMANSCVLSYESKLTHMFSILQDMESRGIVPDALSFSILLEVRSKSNGL